MNERRENTPQPGATELKLLFGRAAGIMGLALALVGALAAEISAEALGIILGMLGYTLGSRWLGLAAVVSSAVMLILVLVVSRGYLPGMEPTYPRGLF